jgi:uncharacterized membrane protein
MGIAASSQALAAAKDRVSGLATPTARLLSVDVLRGLVMVIMALDHTRDFFSYLPFEPEDMSHTYGWLFFTRFVTHYCAPVFAFLAGTGAYLATTRGKSVAQVSRFFLTRGLWLVVLEVTIVDFAWTFIFWPAAGVIWILGWSMVCMALLVRMPVRWIGVFGLAMIATHNLLDRISPASFGKLSWLWMMLHVPGGIQVTPHFIFFNLYVLIPWVGVMAAGYAFGRILHRADRRKWTLALGLAMTALFFLLRGLNLYGNGTVGLGYGFPFSTGPWSVQSTTTLTIISFFNTLKYPPSLHYLLMTLGPSLTLLALFDGIKAERGLGRILLVYGRVPLFYYVLHLYLVHLLAITVAKLFHQPVSWLWHGGPFVLGVPAGYGHGLPFIYGIWFMVLLILYLPCRWFMQYKQQHRDWTLLSYL